MSNIDILGLLAGVLQITGYVLYIKKSLSEEIEPNPMTWFMFAYGVLILGVLEFDRGARWPLLILPISCATLAVVVAVICWRKGKIKWPEKEERTAFLADVVLTVCYVAAWLLEKSGFLSEESRAASAFIFLICTNLTTLTSFWPLLKGTYDEPECEHPLPWSVWAAAYTTLGMATFLEKGIWSEFMIYPIMNAILHGTVSLLARRSRQNS